ncbi:reverse transcriptase domain-containing protein, partial [Tanacetum coccineum]
CLSGFAVAVSDELVFSITQVVNLFLDGSCPKMLGEYIASAPLTPLVKPGGGIRPIVMGTVWRRLVSKVSALMIGHSLDGYLDDLQFSVGVSGGSEAILHAVNRLIEGHGYDVGFLMLLVDFKNAFNLVNREVMLREVRLRCPAISCWVEFCYSNPARLYYGELTLWLCQGVQQGDPHSPLLFALVLHPLICKIRDSFTLSLQAWYLDDGTVVGDTLVVGNVLEPKKDPRSRLTGVFPSNIARPMHGVKLLGGPASVDHDFCSQLVMKRVVKTIGLMDAVAKINDPQCELLLLRSCTGISKLYSSMRTCPPRVFESAQRSFDMALRSSLKRIVIAYGPGFDDWQWRLATLPFVFGGLGVYLAGDVLNYAFLASRLPSAGLQSKLLRHTGIIASGPNFNDALCVFNTSMETDFLSNPSEIAAPKLMKKMADIYFTRVTKNAESTFSYLLDRWPCIPLFSGSKPCSACSRVFVRDIYRDHAVSCAGIIGIKHRHNVVHDTLVDICYRSGILAGLDVCVDLTGSSPLTQTGMVDFIPGWAVIDTAQRKRELEADAVTLLKRIRNFSIT